MKKLSYTEMEIMMRVWKANRKMSLLEIEELVKDKGWARTTVGNFLARIVAKGYLGVERDGRRNLYYPIKTKSTVVNESKVMLERLYGSSLKRFVAALYESDNVSADDLEELKYYLDSKLTGDK